MREDFRSHKAAVRALEVVAREVAASRMRLDDCEPYGLAASRAGVIDAQAEGHLSLLFALSESRILVGAHWRSSGYDARVQARVWSKQLTRGRRRRARLRRRAAAARAQAARSASSETTRWLPDPPRLGARLASPLRSASSRAPAGLCAPLCTLAPDLKY